MEHAGNVSHKNVILAELGFPSLCQHQEFLQHVYSHKYSTVYVLCFFLL